MIIVTGAAGFIGANIVKALNLRGESDIIAVDHLHHADKFHNLQDCEIDDYQEKDDFLTRLQAGQLIGNKIRAVLHQGACSDTMETDGSYMMRNNYGYSLALLEYCQTHQIPFLYASSAAVYGDGRSVNGKRFAELRACERPLNIYGYSKFLFDHIVRRRLLASRSQIAGFRYFNVYGPREQHKGRMASVAWHHIEQYCRTGKVKLFGGHAGYGHGEQCRDFIWIGDVVRVLLYFLDHPSYSGIFNLGSGRAQPFNDVACAVVNAHRRRDGEDPLPLDELVALNMIEYIPFPSALKGKYQSYTCADLTALRATGYLHDFADVDAGVHLYMQQLQTSGS